VLYKGCCQSQKLPIAAAVRHEHALQGFWTLLC